MTVATAKTLSTCDRNKILLTSSNEKTIVSISKQRTIFVQGDSTDSVFYLERGRVQLTVVSQTGKEAIIGILKDGDFFGEGGLAGQSLRLYSATAMTESLVMRIESKAMMEALHREPALSDLFVAYLLARNIRYEEDLVDQICNSSEKRLARVLLLLADFGVDPRSDGAAIFRVDQQTLAAMVGTTRGRVSFFMNKFRRLGFIDYQGRDGLQVQNSLQAVLLKD